MATIGPRRISRWRGERGAEQGWTGAGLPLGRATGWRCSATVVAALTALALLASSAAAVQQPSVRNLRVMPGAGSLVLRWGVGGGANLEGFRIRWRALDQLGIPAEEALDPLAGHWSPPVDVSRGVRRYTILGLAAEPYEVKVRAISSEGLGASVKETAIPLPAEEPPAEEPPAEEPPAEEPPVEEPPVEEPPVEEPAEEPSAPTNLTPPTITGSAIEGGTLNASIGTWTGSPTSYAYQWQDCNSAGQGCSNINGASAVSYTPSASDVAHTLRVVVTAGDAGGSSAADSTPTAIVVAASSGGGAECTSTISSLSQVNSALKAGAVVCLTAGTYGAVSITASPSSNATLTAAPGAHVVVAGVNIAGSNLTVSQLHSTGAINVGSSSPYPGFSHDVIEHNDVGPTNGYGISVMSATSTPSSFITIADNRIHDTSATGEGDALRLDGWNNVTITGNDIYDIKECPGSACHTDTLQSYNSGVPTSGLTIARNYTHDNVGAQGLPFLKDGDISNVLISDNLSVRNSNTNGQVTGVWVDENIVGLTITKNTYQGTSGSIVQADGSAAGPTVAINHNVFDNLNVRPGSGPSYTTTEDYDIFTGNDEYTFKLGPHSALSSNPAFLDTATDDYRLANNPNGIGVDWSPAEEQYGPSS